MRVVRYRSREWDRYLESLPRTSAARPEVDQAVADILRAVRRDGDRALIRFNARFDRVKTTAARLKMKPAEVERLARRASPEIVRALAGMARQIDTYHRQQLDRGFRLKFKDGSV